MPFVSADIMPSIIKDAFTKLFGGSYPEVYVQRTIIWILFFAIYYFASSFVFIDKATVATQPKKFSGVRTIVAVVLAVITAIGIPDPWLAAIFNVWGWAGGLIIILTPVLGIMFLAHMAFPQNRFGDGFRAVIFLISIVLLYQIITVLDTFANQPPGFSLSDFTQLIIFIFFIMAVINAFRAMFGTRTVYPENQPQRDTGWNYNLGDAAGVNPPQAPNYVPGPNLHPQQGQPPVQPPPVQPPQPPYPAHLRQVLANISANLQQYSTAVNQFRQEGLTIVNVNYHATRTPPACPAVTVNHWNAYNAAAAQVNALDNTINGLFQNLNADPGFPNFNDPQDVARLNALIQIRGQYLNIVSTFIGHFQTAFATNQAAFPVAALPAIPP